MGRLYPQLYDPAYYRSLLDKEYAHKTPLYAYTEKKISITPADFDHLVETINNSGYWTLPLNPTCDPTTDGWGFSLEANTASQYNIVFDGSCAADTGRLKYACQELVRYAGLQKKIHLYSDRPYEADTTR